MRNKAAFIESMRSALDLLREVVTETPEVSMKLVNAMQFIEHAMRELSDNPQRPS